MRFNYQARNQQGQTQTGIVEASSRETALGVLQKYGLYVTYLAEEKRPFYATQIKLFQRTGAKDIVLFSRQLAIMFKSEVSLVEALRSLSEQAGNADFREKILSLAQAVEGGTSFSGALSEFPKIFSPFFINMVKSGESAGKLSEVLEYLADHLEREYEINSRMKGAMVYPAMIVMVAFVVFLLMIFFVLPNMTRILTETAVELPLPTKIVIAVSDLFRSWWWLMAGLLVTGIAALARHLRTEQGKRNFDAFILKVPLIGDLARKMFLARFAENLSTLIAGGLPIAQALEFSGEVVGNRIYREIIFEARDGVRRGEAISAVLRRYPKLFPPMVIQMVYVGERSGSVEKTLRNVVTFYQAEVQRTTDSLLSLLEPLMIVVLGGMVALVVAAVLLPLYRISGL